MRTIIFATAAAGLLAACSDNAAEQPEKEARAEALQPGEYEVTARVDDIRSTDNSTPATAAKAGDSADPKRVCLAADTPIDPAIFAGPGETCSRGETYMRGGRMSLQYQCTLPGKGQLGQLVDGTFTADSFEAKVMTSTYFAADGDYRMTRTLTGKRVGDCPPAAAAGAGQNQSGTP